jgi:hypothetical protein
MDNVVERDIYDMDSSVEDEECLGDGDEHR